MTVPFWCLFVAALIPILLAFSGGYFKSQQFGSVDNELDSEDLGRGRLTDVLFLPL